MNNYTYVSYLSSDDYLEGILVLNKNLQLINSKYPLIIICTDNLNEKTYKKLKEFNINYKKIKQKIIKLESYFNIKQPRWINTLNKIEIFNLVEYDRCIYLDCDMLILDNLDYLFEKSSEFICGSYISPDIYAPAPQSNILVYTPNKDIYQDILNIALNHPIQGGDEYYIFNYLICNNYSLELLPREFNCTSKENCLKGFNNFQKKIKIIHCVGEKKPWQCSDNELNQYFLDREFPKEIKNLYKKLYLKATDKNI